MAALHALLSLKFQVDQINSSTVTNILAIDLTGHLDRQVLPRRAGPGEPHV